MTKNERMIALLELGFTHCGIKIKPDLYYHYKVGNINIPKDMKLKTIIEIVHDNAYREGIDKGKRERSNEIMSLLNIRTCKCKITKKGCSQGNLFVCLSFI